MRRGGCVVETRDKRGRGCMHLSGGRGKLRVVEYLWSKGLDVDVEDGGAFVYISVDIIETVTLSLQLID